MKATDAITLDNFFPGTDNVKLRPGHSEFADGLGSDATETLIAYASGASTALLGICEGDVYDVTAGGAVGAALKSGLTNSRFQWVNFKGYALFFNGLDTPQKYDGSAVTDTVITGSGLTATDLIAPWIFKERVFLIERDTLSAWYLGTGAIAGSASELDFSGFCKLGGKLVAGGTWTRDGGSGPDDFCVFLTSKGEALVYQGTDPSDAATWALVGVYKIGEPIGDKPLMNLATELVAITTGGFQPLSKALSGGGSTASALSDKIRNAVNTATRSYGGLFGWEGIYYPRANWVLFNVPIHEGVTSHQYVANEITGSWCRFKGMNASCWAVHDGQLYFGGAGGMVFLADDGRSDNGEGIVGDIVPAFNYFGRRGQQKRFTAARPVFSTDGNVEVTYTLNTDFELRTPDAVITVVSPGSEWDEDEWDVAIWAGGLEVRKAWRSLAKVGYCASLATRVVTYSVQVELNTNDYVFEPGGVF